MHNNGVLYDTAYLFKDIMTDNYRQIYMLLFDIIVDRKSVCRQFVMASYANKGSKGSEDERFKSISINSIQFQFIKVGYHNEHGPKTL